jgi:hypothetical protein
MSFSPPSLRRECPLATCLPLAAPPPQKFLMRIRTAAPLAGGKPNQCPLSSIDHMYP